MAKDKKKGRGHRSKVDLLPEELKKHLDEMLRDGRLQQSEILEIINQKIDDAGLPEDDKLSRSGLNRYSVKMEAAGSRIREAREVSKQWVAELGTAPEGEVSKILIEMVRTMAFDTVLKASEGDDPVHPKFIKELAIGVEKLEKAASESTKREREIREQVLAEQKEKLDELKQDGELDQDVLNKVIKAAYGL